MVLEQASKLLLPGELSDDAVLLRPFTEADIPALIKIVDDTTIHDRNHAPSPTEEAIREWINNGVKRAEAGQSVQFAVCDKATGALAGRRGIRLEQDERRARVGAWIGKEWRGQGFSPRSARLVAAWAFDMWPVDRIGAECDVDNEASYKALIKAGFKCEGVLRAYSLSNSGERRDQYSFSLLPEDL